MIRFTLACVLDVLRASLAACGADANVIITRDFNRLPYSMFGRNNGLFDYDAPVLKCVGEPFADSTKSGCSRVMIDGLNLGVAGDERTYACAHW